MRGEGCFVTVFEKRIFSALLSDVDNLAKKFCEQDSLDISKFIDLFISAEFSTIFVGRLSISELAEFSENLLLYCARYMFSNLYEDSRRLPTYCVGRDANNAYEISRLKLGCERSLKERIFGVYMVYCVYILQFAEYAFPIRVSVPQMKNLYEFMTQTLMPGEHFFALFCIYRLVGSGAFTVTPFETDFNPLLIRTFDTCTGEKAAELNDLERTGNFDILNTVCKDPLLKKLRDIHNAYSDVKSRGGFNLTTIDAQIGNLGPEIETIAKTARVQFYEERDQAFHDDYSAFNNTI